MRDTWKIIGSAFKKIYAEIEATKSLSELQEILSKNRLEVSMELFGCSGEDSYMLLGGCASRKNPFDAETTVCYFLDDDVDGEEVSVHLMGIPLLLEEEIEAWKKSYFERLKRGLLSLGED